jgi:hypothetical protein
MAILQLREMQGRQELPIVQYRSNSPYRATAAPVPIKTSVL